MSAILGLGLTHYPPLCGRDEEMARILKRVLQDPDLPESYRRQDGWPAPMREEYGADEGLSAARRHRESLIAGFRDMRKQLDDFAPDLVLIWGDDQYENFKEDVIPPFCIAGYDPEFDLKPWAHSNGSNGVGKPNRWDEPGEWAMPLKGHREAAKYIATGLMERG